VPKRGRQIDPRVRAWFYSESWAELENVLRVSALALLRNVAIARLQTDLQSLPANGVRGRRRKTDFPLAIPTNGLVKEEVAGKLDVFAYLLPKQKAHFIGIGNMLFCSAWLGQSRG
jgi:hypothetical protein